MRCWTACISRHARQCSEPPVCCCRFWPWPAACCTTREQGCNHFIAFKLLALIRDKVFGALRQLAPAKLEGRDKGDLIAVLTADIELLEVFYAHTISPICIAVIVSVVMACLYGQLCTRCWGCTRRWPMRSSASAYPWQPPEVARKSGESFRAEFGALNGFVLDSLRGVRESLQYNDGAHRLAQINQRTDALARQERRLKEAGGTAQAVTGAIILLLDAGMLALAGRPCSWRVPSGLTVLWSALWHS